MPEEANTWVAGFVLEVPKVRGLSFTVDYFKLNQNNVIQNVGTGPAIDRDEVILDLAVKAELAKGTPINQIDLGSGTSNYAFIWAFYSFFALIAVPANLPLSIDDADYVVTLRAIHMPSGKVVGTYQSSVHLHSWRGAWSLFETFYEDPGQVFDIANRELLNKVVDDYPKFRAVTLRPASAREERL